MEKNELNISDIGLAIGLPIRFNNSGESMSGPDARFGFNLFKLFILLKPTQLLITTVLSSAVLANVAKETPVKWLTPIVHIPVF